MDVPIIHEDGGVVVLNKPAGLVVHADGRTKEKTLTDWLLERYPDMRHVGEPLRLSDGSVIERPGIVHRIDRDTSGVLIVAKNQPAFEHLKEQFKNRHVEKKYLVFLYGVLKDDVGTIDRPIGKSKKDFRLRVAVDTRLPAGRQTRGALRDAETAYRVLQRGRGVTYVEAKPKTGRTHQIRVHFKSISHPVVCDKLYAPRRECVLGFERMALHAHSLALTLPSGNKLVVEAPLPPDFENALLNMTTS